MTDLATIREQLDGIDSQIVSLVAQRVELCRDIAHIKREGSIAMMQPDRLAVVRGHFLRDGMAKGLDRDFLERFVDLLVGETCRVERAIIEADS